RTGSHVLHWPRCATAGRQRSAHLPAADPQGRHREDWTPRELRHSFVSLLSDNGVPLEAIADLCGHSGTTVTERVNRHQLRPVLLGGAVAMDTIFGARKGASRTA